MSTTSGDLPTFVLVHGAGSGPECWRFLAPALRAAGYGVDPVALPSSGPQDPVRCDLMADAAVVRAAAAAHRRTIVVCHSYGGMPTTQALAGSDGVLGLVYLAAFLPHEGESLGDIADGDDDDGEWTWSDDGHTVAPVDVASLACGHCPPELAAIAVAEHRPQAAITFDQAVTQAAWRTTPTSYVICTDDRAIEPSLQRRMARHADTVYELHSDHSPFLSHPDETARILLEDARRRTAAQTANLG